MKQAALTIAAAFIVALSAPVTANDAITFGLQLASCPAESIKTSTPNRPIDIPPDSIMPVEKASERIHRMSERKMHNKELYRFTEKPSNYIHSMHQDYIPW